MIVYMSMFCILLSLIFSVLVAGTTTAATDVPRNCYLPHNVEFSLTRGGAKDGASAASSHGGKKLVVVGSANADCFLSVEQLPVAGENLMCTKEPVVDVPGTCTLV